MTLQDFSVEFDLLYNNALSNSAPEIKGYEKSMFLTQAQDEIVKELYEDTTKNTGFESSERIRRRLNTLLTPANSTFDSGLNSSLASFKVDVDSKFYQIEDDAWYLLYETISNTNTERYIVPVSLDEYSILSDNPFKYPNNKRSWRLDIKDTSDGKRVVEVVTNVPATGSVYHYRYLKAPTPIVLEDITDTVGAGYAIEGVTIPTECKMPNELHRIILKRAVELATLAYKENTLQNNVQLNTRIN
jgi:hypothetical protein